MPFTRLLTRYFPWLLAVCAVPMAYFQAIAINQLLALLLLDPGAQHAAPAQPPLAPKARIREASAILAKNPFDSSAHVEQPRAPRRSLGMLDAPTCAGVSSEIITQSSDRAWSLATLRGAGDPGAHLRRVGDEVAGKRVVFIGWNPRHAAPSVWLADDAELCQAPLFSEAAAPAAPPPHREAASGIDAQIRRVSENEFEIERDLVNRIITNHLEFMRGVRIVPETKEGVALGFRLFGVRADSVLAKLGFQNGDRFDSINGFSVAVPEKALEAYARLRNASAFSVELNRDGKQTRFEYRVR